MTTELQLGMKQIDLQNKKKTNGDPACEEAMFPHKETKSVLIIIVT